MDIGRILDGTPSPPIIAHSPSYFTDSGSGEYTLPVPMTEFQRQLSDDVVSLHYSDILRFYEHGASTAGNEVLFNSLQSLLANLQLVATHPYLLVEQYLPANLVLKGVSAQLTRSSGKFAVFGYLIDLIRERKWDVAVVVMPKALDLVEALLLGKTVNVKRHSGPSLKSTHKNLKKYSTIHVISSEDTYTGPEMFDLVIAFDQTFVASRVDHLRSEGRKDKAPVISMLPYYSAEHIAHNFHHLQNDSHAYLQRVVAAIVVLRGRVGRIPLSLKPYYAVGLKYLVPWLQDTTSVWPIPKEPSINEYRDEDVEASLLVEVSVADPQPADSSTPVPNGKDNGEPPEEEESQKPDQLNDDDEYIHRRIKRELFSPDLLDAHLRSPTKEIVTHRILRRLENALTDLDLKSVEFESLQKLATTRPDIEIEDAKLGVMKEIEVLQEKLQIYERKTERHNSEMAQLRETLEKQRSEIASAHEQLAADDGAGEIKFAELEKQRQRVRELEQDVARAKETLQSRGTEHSYMQVEFQKAAASTISSNSEAQELQTQQTELKTKVDAMIKEYQSQSFAPQSAQLNANIKELEGKLATAEENVKRVIENEKQHAGRSRYAMRSGSAAPRRTNSPSTPNSRRSSVSDRESANQNGNTAPHPLQNVTKY